ncbi:MAG: phenylalanine--tRNA ligase subunit beta [Candidatus Magasanikbacteria bacterium RIFCSPHIGHO2_02_FULL_41_13]|uniref:Phenylalanine--tRNA ligase beta subunit n=1 Tax=Candidatus Magasanikbacteria bacterium RIFCSPHIGHO2_02_FULL_41_13 TaxID=1798676 RepID=A0A1F6M550_9BACT|nr:MAG: phenylalanine--tRNA ligase subunit beta [Candidatus Magasanikbacteria bacterium RIFCSPHIGHO2_02_FULL_41_13]
MKISKKWLQEFVFLPDSLSAEELGKELTLRTVEVEGVEDQAKNLNHIIVAQIKSIEKHPNADKLRVCQVDAGVEIVQIVCGGSNLEVGMKVVLAKIGATVLWHGQGDPIIMEKATLRGVDSYGMICTSDEVGLLAMFPKKDDHEVVDLTHLKDKAGTPLAKALHLDDVSIEVDNKSLSNRPDLWGHIGMAREVATIYHKKFTVATPPEIKAGSEMKLSVTVEDATLCPRYMAVALSGIHVEASPGWMQKRLEACGIRPINNIVDITNYVMLEIGQPCHAFDASKIAEQKIIVRRAKEAEKFVTLDQKEHTLTSDMLMIADGEKSLALAGIMGGLHSGINENTTSIVFESATFEAGSIRKTSTRLGLRTDSSARFEKSLDPVNALLALRRLVELTLQICKGSAVASPVVDLYPKKPGAKIIATSFEFLEGKIGMSLDHKKVVDILERLGFTIEKGKKGALKITVPSWRATKDISIAEDIVEEVIRIIGYENVPSTLPVFSITPPRQNSVKVLERKIKELLALESCFTETYNYSFESPEWLQKLGVDSSLHLELENPIAKDRPLIRRSLIPNLIENVESNLHRFDEIKMFETGRVYKIEEAGERVEAKDDGLLPRQDTYLGLVYAKKSETTPFFVLSKVIADVFARLHVAVEIIPAENESFAATPFVHPGRFAFLKVAGTIVGRMSELHPSTAKNLGISQRLAFGEINLNILSDHQLEEVSYSPLSVYPDVVRDIAIVLEKNVMHANLVAALRSVDPLIVSVELFDVYEGERLGENKKSMAYHITYRDTQKTLTTAEVDDVHKKVLDTLQKNFAAEIRK